MKVQALNFLLKAAGEVEEGEDLEERTHFLDLIHRTAFTSQLRQLLSGGEGRPPSLFLSTLLDFISKLIDLDPTNTLTLLTSLDVWTLFTSLTDYSYLMKN